MKLSGLPRKAVIAHLPWAVVTTGALILGAQLADNGQDKDYRTVRIPNSIERTNSSGEVAESEAHVYVPLPGVKPTKSADLVPLAGQAKSMTGLMRSRNRQGDPETWEKFVELESRELESDDPAAQQLLRTFELSDHVLNNDGSLDDLKMAMMTLLEGLGGNQAG